MICSCGFKSDEVEDATIRETKKEDNKPDLAVIEEEATAYGVRVLFLRVQNLLLGITSSLESS